MYDVLELPENRIRELPRSLMISLGTEMVKNEELLKKEFDDVNKRIETKISTNSGARHYEISDETGTLGDYHILLGYNKKNSGGWNVIPKQDTLLIRDEKSYRLEKDSLTGLMSMDELILGGAYKVRLKENSNDDDIGKGYKIKKTNIVNTITRKLSSVITSEVAPSSTQNPTG